MHGAYQLENDSLSNKNEEIKIAYPVERYSTILLAYPGVVIVHNVPQIDLTLKEQGRLGKEIAPVQDIRSG